MPAGQHAQRQSGGNLPTPLMLIVAELAPSYTGVVLLQRAYIPRGLGDSGQTACFSYRPVRRAECGMATTTSRDTAGACSGTCRRDEAERSYPAQVRGGYRTGARHVRCEARSKKKSEVIGEPSARLVCSPWKRVEVVRNRIDFEAGRQSTGTASGFGF